MEEVDFRAEDIQELLDIRPSKVWRSKTSGPSSDSSKDPNVPETGRSDPNIFEYFGLDLPKIKYEKETLSQLKTISDRLSKETSDTDEMFGYMRIIERAFWDDDPFKRIEYIHKWLKSKQGKSLKTLLESDELLDPLEVLEQHAKDTGDWTEYLKLAEKRNKGRGKAKSRS